MHPTQSSRARSALRATALAGTLAIILGACSSPASTAPSSSPGSSPTAGTGELVLDRVPDDTACDAIGVDYRSVTFHIDPTATPQIWAVADTGTSLLVRFGSAFEPGTGSEPSVVDADGATIVEEGMTLENPSDAWPEIEGHMVCPGPSSLTILNGPTPTG